MKKHIVRTTHLRSVDRERIINALQCYQDKVMSPALRPNKEFEEVDELISVFEVLWDKVDIVSEQTGNQYEYEEVKKNDSD